MERRCFHFPSHENTDNFSCSVTVKSTCVHTVQTVHYIIVNNKKSRLELIAMLMFGFQAKMQEIALDTNICTCATSQCSGVETRLEHKELVQIEGSNVAHRHVVQ